MLENITISSDVFTLSIYHNQQLLNMSLKPLTEKLLALNPKAILERGYSVAFLLPTKKIIKSSKDLNTNQEFELLTSEGSFSAKKIKNIKSVKSKQ